MGDLISSRLILEGISYCTVALNGQQKSTAYHLHRIALELTHSSEVHYLPFIYKKPKHGD